MAIVPEITIFMVSMKYYGKEPIIPYGQYGHRGQFPG